MEDLFRLVLMRPAVAQDKQQPSIDLTQESSFQGGLAAALKGADPRAGAAAEARTFVTTDGFLGDPDDNPFAKKLGKLSERLDGLANPDADSTRKAVAQAFGKDVDEVVKDDSFKQTVRRLRDSIVAIKVIDDDEERPLEELVGQLRLMELIIRMGEDAKFPADAEALRLARFRTLQFPDGSELASRLSTRKTEDQKRKQAKAAKGDREGKLDKLLKRHESLSRALDELAAIHSSHLITTPQAGSDAIAPPEDLRSDSVAKSQVGFLSKMRAIQVKGSGGDGQPEEGDEKRAPGSGLVAELLGAGRARSGRPGFKPQDVAFTLNPQGSDSLSPATRAVLDERGLDLSQIPLDRVVDRLQGELARVVLEIERLGGHPTKTAVKRVGKALVTVHTPITTGWGAVGTGGFAAAMKVALDGRVPQTRGKVKPAGVADLLLVRQQLVGYEGADVADIENVLKGEHKTREHTRRQETVLTTFTETETETTKEQEHDATDRFEMARETSETIKEDIALKAGVKVSGKYGPVVEFAVSAEGSYQRTKEEATKTAQKFAHDVTDRSSRKIAERVLERTTITTTTDVTEKNIHEIDNKGPGAAQVSGVYQWVNKRYQAQMFNYGLRAMFDFMVPEPAAFLIAAMNAAHASTLTLTKPPDFALKPSEVTESNYGYWTREYRATDITPPPDLYKTASMDFKAGSGDDSTNYNHSAEVTIDEGYRAVWSSVGAVYTNWSGDCVLDVIVGQSPVRLINGEFVKSTNMADEQGTVPVAISTYKMAQIAIAIEIKCQRTDRALEKWQLDTHRKLMTAWQARVQEYEERLAQLEAQAGDAIEGRNPAANREIIEDELKKNCLSILTDQHFDLFDAIEDSPSNSLPEIDIFEAAGEGPYVRFFEQAFEWEHMAWVTYPYFWGRKDQWDERIAYEDPDPAFNEFLRAGYARVTVPARPGFESAIDHFLHLGDIWKGGPLPSITSKLYLKIADELAEQLGRPAREVPQGDPWPVTVPTALVHLRSDDKLPKWQQDAQGNWVEA